MAIETQVLPQIESPVADETNIEPWPLDTKAPFRLFAWPRYDAPEELTALFQTYGVFLRENTHVALCLRYDFNSDVPYQAAIARLQEAAKGALGNNCRISLLIINERLTQAEWPRLGAAVHCAVDLPSAHEGPRAAMLQTMQTPLVNSVAELERRLEEADLDAAAIARNLPPDRTPERSDIMQRWLDMAWQDCVPYFPPFRLDISITSMCNLRCGYCWQQEKTPSRLTFDNLAEVMDSITTIWPPRMLITGGEPTTWPDLERFIAYCKNMGVDSLQLCTNGVKLRNYERAKRLVEAGVTTLNISVDTLNAERFESLRGFKFSRLEQTLENCIRLKQEHPDLILCLASVISKAVTPQDICDVKNFAAKHGFRHFMQTFDPTAYPEINARFQFTPEEERAFKSKLGWLDGLVRDVVQREENPLTESAHSKCYKGVTTVKLDSEGDVKFCWRSRAIGNILEQPFQDIWTSPAAKAMREYIRDRKCNCNFDCDIFESLELPSSVQKKRC